MLSKLLQTTIEHTNSAPSDVVVQDISHGVLQRVGEGIVLDHHFHAIGFLLLVLLNNINRCIVVRNLLIQHGCGILRCLDTTEQFLDLTFDAVNIHITHHDDSLVTWMVPFLVVVAQGLRLEVVNHLHQTDRKALSVLTARIELGQTAFDHTPLCGATQAPFLMDHTTLLVNLLGFEQQTVSPVVQDQQTAVLSTCSGRRHIRDIVHSTVVAGVGIQVNTKLHTNALTVAHHLVTGEILRTVEAHVLQEVSQSALVFILLDRSHFLCDVELSPVFRPVVVTDVISQSVVQFTNPHVFVNWKLWHLLRRSTYGDEEKCHHEKFS